MNYFEHHIGDYDEATAHLSACEDGIYSRLIRKYYATEAPLMADVPKLQRLVRARTREEREAVVAVLEEFFRLEADGWHQEKCDEVIAAYRAGEPEREVKKANEDNRVRRHREERATLFKIVTDAGQHLAWNIPITELRAIASRLQAETCNGQQPLPVTQPVTAPVTPATATHTPLTSPQALEHEQSLPPSAGASPPEKVPDPIFGNGLAFLVRKGVPEKGARSFLGLMRKQCSDLLTAELLAKAESDDVSDPLAWLRAAGKARAGPKANRPAVNASFAGKDYSVGATPDDQLFDQFRSH